MKITIDTGVDFEFSGGRKAVVDAWEFNDWLNGLWESKGVLEPKKDGRGNPILLPDGQPELETEKTLKFSVLYTEIQGYFRDHAKIEIKLHEAEAIYAQWRDKIEGEGENAKVKHAGIFTKKKRLLLNQEPTPDLPTLSASSGLESWD